MESNTLTYKLLVVGESSVGKSSILLRYTNGQFTDNYNYTVGVDFKVKKIIHKNKEVTLQLWDTAGQERYRSVTRTFYHRAKGVVVVFDLSNRKTLEAVTRWLMEIQENCDEIPRILVGNKCDSLREVKEEEGAEVAKRFGLPYMETSAKEDININSTFNKLVEIIHSNDEIRNKNQKNNENKIQLENNKKRKKKKKKRGCFI
jgi:Ras-related protein Rab-35